MLATVYRATGKALGAVGSWATRPADVMLTIDFKALGLDPAKTTLATPAIEGFQKAQAFDVDKPIPVQPRKGWLLVLKERWPSVVCPQGPIRGSFPVRVADLLL